MMRQLTRITRWLAALGFVLLIATGCWVFRAPLLAGAARCWIADDSITKSDAVVVLGGGLPQRALEAARLYQAGLASRILYMDVKKSVMAREGLLQTETALTRELLLRHDVPESALVCVGESVSNTYEEVIAVRDWMRQAGAKSVIIPTEDFHTRRVRWLFRKMLTPGPATVEVEAIANPEYRSSKWWQTEAGLIAFQNEVIKYFYYRFTY
jgi:uncharacterized SAM-binding protein YcdF (DUF218 family)